MSGLCSTTEAKAEYFLDTQDLAGLYGASGGWGEGRLRLYDRRQLAACALAKYGEAGFQAKLDKRAALLSKKRKREEDAAAAAAAAERALSTSAPQPSDPAVLGTVKSIRASLKKQVRSALGFKEASDCPNSFKLELPGISPEVFAHLAGKPADKTLSTFVKKAGIITVTPVDIVALMGLKSGDELPTKSARMTTLKPEDTVMLKYKPAAMVLTVQGDSEFDERGF